MLLVFVIRSGNLANGTTTVSLTAKPPKEKRRCDLCPVRTEVHRVDQKDQRGKADN